MLVRWLLFWFGFFLFVSCSFFLSFGWYCYDFVFDIYCLGLVIKFAYPLCTALSSRFYKRTRAMLKWSFLDNEVFHLKKIFYLFVAKALSEATQFATMAKEAMKARTKKNNNQVNTRRFVSFICANFFPFVNQIKCRNLMFNASTNEMRERARVLTTMNFQAKHEQT